jgi:hypothetical protein
MPSRSSPLAHPLPRTFDRATPLEPTPFPLDPVLVAAGATLVGRSLRRSASGWKRYPGDVMDICHAVLEDCWNGKFIAGSAGHFCQFWTRDLSFCTPALIRLGMRDRVIASFAWALPLFEKNGGITTTIFGDKYPRDVYDFGADSLPMLLFALREAGATELIEKHKDFLGREIARYVRLVLCPDLGLARPGSYFSAPADCVRARSSTFSNTMLALLEQELALEPRLPNPMLGHDTAGRLLRSHWTGQFFRHALDHETPSGCGNLFPYFFKIFGDDDMVYRERSFRTLEARGFSEPIPLRYFEQRNPETELPVPRFFTPNYQGDTTWMQLCPLYISELRSVDPARALELRDRVARIIECDGNYLEMYDRDLRPYTGRGGLYHADEGMIWAALFLDLF